MVTTRFDIFLELIKGLVEFAIQLNLMDLDIGDELEFQFESCYIDNKLVLTKGGGAYVPDIN